MGITSIFFFSTYIIFAKVLLEKFNPETLVGLSQLISAIAILFFYGFLPELKKIHKLPSKTLFWLTIISLLAAVLAPMLLLNGLKVTTATNTIIISMLEPVFTGIIAFFILKETMSRNQLFGSILMIIGIIIIGTKGIAIEPTFNQGDILIVISALCWALSTIIFKKYLHHIAPELIVLLRNLIGAVAIFLVLPAIFDLDHNLTPLTNSNLLGHIIIFSLFTILISQMLWYKSLELIPANIAGSLSLFGPISSLFLAVTILKENLYTYHFIGGFLVIAGLILIVRHQQKHKHNHLIQKLKHHEKAH
jgi:drug/metabolite transporter (DMT)-like permease